MPTKKCDACRELIDSEATICPKCRSKQKGRSSLGVIFGGGAALLLFLLWLGGSGDTPTRDPATEFENGYQSTGAEFSAEKKYGCEKALSQAETDGLVRERPSKTRINVEDALWAALPAGEKTALMSLVGCAAFGKQPADFGTSEYVVAYGYRSGQRLGMLSDLGMKYD
jgi:hypothetical protein